MIDKVIENNRVSIIGEIVSEFKFSHEVFGEGFYTVDVSVDRLSELTDVIPLMVSERLVDVSEDYQGRLVEVSGQFRSYNRHEGAKNKLVLSIFVREWEEVEENLESGKTNQIFLDGYICKAPIYRKTPLGRNARYASTFEVGGHIQIWGRVQSREYVKKINEEESEKHVAYEVSVSKLEYIDE